MRKRRIVIVIVAVLVITAIGLLFAFYRQKGTVATTQDNLERIYQRANNELGKNNYNKALKDYLYIIQDKEDSNTCDTLLINSYGNAALVYIYFSDYESALQYYEKGYKLSVKSEDYDRQFKFLINLIGIYTDSDTKKAKEYCEVLHNLNGISKGKREYYYYFDLGHIAKAEKDYDKAIELIGHTFSIIDIYHLDRSMKMFSYSEMSDIYDRMGKLDLALQQQDSAYSLAKDNDRGYNLLGCYESYSKLYKEKGDSSLAVKYQNLHQKLNDSLLNVKEYAKVRINHENFENRRTDDKIQNLQSTNSILSKVILVAVLIIIAIILIAIIKHIAKSKATQGRTKIDSSTSDEDIIRKIDEMVTEDDYCNEGFTLNALAKTIESNTAYVSRAINNQYHKNFRTFVNEKRIHIVMKRMGDEKYSKFSIQGIAESVGFKSVSNFNSTFKKVTGMTPSQYQKLSSKEKLC